MSPVGYLHGGSIRVGIEGNDLDPVALQLKNDFLAQFARSAKEDFLGRGFEGRTDGN